MKNIEIGKTYNYFDDGKIRESRRMSVKVTEIIPYDKLTDSEILSMWRDEVKECKWLYSPITDYFIKGALEMTDSVTEEVIFVRTLNNGWFSLGWWAGRLDVDNSLTQSLY